MDRIGKETRSRLMARIRSKGNQSTERKLRMLLVRAGISGWQILPKSVMGNPDFVFSGMRLAVFVDGCFWHGCPKCYHRPLSNRKYWDAKMRRNKERDKRLRAKMRRNGWKVLRVWEHELLEAHKVISRISKALDHLHQS